MTTYAKANRTAQWFGEKYTSATFKPNCGVLHTTEGFGWPGYGGGAKAPNYTANPNFATERLDWRAHFEDEESSRALENRTGGVETNTANAVQVELVGTCDPKNAKTWAGKVAGKDYIYWPNAPQWALKSLAEFIADMNKRHGIKIQGPASGFVAYPESYGPGGQRFTFAQWRNFYGWCGHQHVPENDHGDPGALPWGQIETYAKALLSGQPTPSKPTTNTGGTDVATPNEIWGADIIPAPDPTDKKNPFWTPASYLIWTLRGVDSIKKTLESLKDISSKQDQILAKQDEILNLLKSKTTI